MKDSIPKRDMPAAFARATVCCSLFVDLPEMRANSANKFSTRSLRVSQYSLTMEAGCMTC